MSGDLEIGHSWLARWIELERYHNLGSPNQLSFINDTSAGTSARFGLPSVQIPLVHVPNGTCTLVGDANRSELASSWVEEDVIPIHPDSIGYYFTSGRDYSVSGYIEGVPSASGRTLLVRDASEFRWLKLSYPGKLGRFSAPIDEEKVRHSTETSIALSSCRDCSVISEPCGIVVRRRSGASIGIILRDVFDRRPTASVIPAFSLLDSTSGTLPALISNEDPTSKLFLNIIKPVLTAYFHICVSHLILPEPHAQNMLLAADPEGRVRCVFRDMQGFRNEATPDRSKAGNLVERSRRFDDFLVRYFLLPLLISAAGACELSFDRVIDMTRALVKTLTPPGYFPQDVRYEMPLHAPLYGQRLQYIAHHGIRPLFR